LIYLFLKSIKQTEKRRNIEKTRKPSLLSLSTNALAVELSLFLQNSLPNTFTLGQGYQGLIPLTDHKNIGDTGGKGMTGSILDVDDIERSLVLFLVNNGTYATVVMSSSSHGEVANIKLNEITNLSSFQIKHNRIVDLDIRIGVADGATVVSGDVRDSSLTEFETLNLAELVRSFFLADAVDNKPTLGIVEETEVLVSLGDIYDVHVTHRVGFIGADLAIDLNQTVHEDRHDLLAIQGIPEK